MQFISSPFASYLKHDRDFDPSLNQNEELEANKLEVVCPVMITIQKNELPEDLVPGLINIALYSPYEIIYISDVEKLIKRKETLEIASKINWEISFIQDYGLEVGQYKVSHLQATDTGSIKVKIQYFRKIEAFKAMGRLLGLAFQTRKHAADELDLSFFEELLNFDEKAQFETLCLMVDCSRNAVPTVNWIKRFLCYGALMGFNMLQLYTEDTYEIPDEPFFGFCRGGYSFDELKKIDDFAYDLGVEVVACIQTLGHLGQILQWPRFQNLRDTTEVLLADGEETYEFIERMITSATAPLRSKKIHIGMDEAFGLGQGRYQERIRPCKNEIEIFIYHLNRVREICYSLNLKPLMWSDMIFCLGSKDMSLNGYYNVSKPAPFSNELTKDDGLELVYWDYYHVNPQAYSNRLLLHHQLGCNNPWMAGGAWTWSRHWCSIPYSIKSCQASLTASKLNEGGTRNYMLTIWGDEGAECDFYSALPVMAYVSLQAYTEKTVVDEALLVNYFAGVCGGDFNAWYEASRLDNFPFLFDYYSLSEIQQSHVEMINPFNPSKQFLWEDPFYSIMSAAYREYAVDDHYHTLYNYLMEAIQQKQDLYPLNSRLRLPAYLAKVLMLKVKLREKLVDLYRFGEKTELSLFVSSQLRDLKDSIIRLWQYHRSMWLNNNKPFGWEVLDLRYGGLVARINTMISRITDHCNYMAKQNLWVSQDDYESDINNEEENYEATNPEPNLPLEELSSMVVLEEDSAEDGIMNRPKPFKYTSKYGNSQPDQQFALWPEHSFEENGSINNALTTIPEFEKDIPPPFELKELLRNFDYQRICTTSRNG